MPKGLLFWVVFVVAFIFGLVTTWPNGPGAKLQPFNGFVLLVLIFLLGWGVYGFVVQ